MTTKYINYAMKQKLATKAYNLHTEAGFIQLAKDYTNTFTKQ